MKPILYILSICLLFGQAYAQNGGKALSFASTATFGSHIRVADDASHSLCNQDGISIEMWIKTGPDLSTYQNLFYKEGQGGMNIYIGQHWSDNGSQGRITMTPQPLFSSDFLRTDQLLEPNQWYHIACVMQYPLDYIYIYVNGEEVAYKPISDAAYGSSDEDLLIGSNEFTGIMEEVRVWSTGLSESTIQAWMHRDVHAGHPEIANLSAYFNFNEGSGTVANSNLGPINSGVIEGNLLWADSDIPTAGDDPEFANYEQISAIWQTKTSATIGGWTFASNSIPDGRSFVVGASPNFDLTDQGLQHCGNFDYKTRRDFSWQLLKQGSVNLDQFEFDLSEVIPDNQHFNAGMFYGDDLDDFSTTHPSNCPTVLLEEDGVFSPFIAPSSTSQLNVDYIGLGLGAPQLSACWDPAGGLQIAVNASSACPDANPSGLPVSEAVGFHSGGTPDVNEEWGNHVDWQDPNAQRAYRQDGRIYRVYIPDVDAYYGEANIKRINFVYNQGFSNPSFPWDAMAKKYIKTEDDCSDYYLMLDDITETCKTTATAIAQPLLDLGFEVASNPFSTHTQIRFDNPKRMPYQVQLLNMQGQVLRNYVDVQEEQLNIDRGDLPAGIYLARFQHPEEGQASTRLMIR